MRTLWLLALFTLTLWAADSRYQTGTLIDVTHQDSSRTVGSTQNGTGSVTSVTDREYNLTVKVGEMTYVGSYWRHWKWSYEPTDFTINGNVEVRLTAKEMYLVKRDGKELRTKIIKRISASPAASH